MKWTEFVKTYMHCKKTSVAVFSIKKVTVSKSFVSLIHVDSKFFRTFIRLFSRYVWLKNYLKLLVIHSVYCCLSLSFQILYLLRFFISCNWQKWSNWLNKATLVTNWMVSNQNNPLLSDCCWLEPWTT